MVFQNVSHRCFKKLFLVFWFKRGLHSFKWHRFCVDETKYSKNNFETTASQLNVLGMSGKQWTFSGCFESVFSMQLPGIRFRVSVYRAKSTAGPNKKATSSSNASIKTPLFDTTRLVFAKRTLLCAYQKFAAQWRTGSLRKSKLPRNKHDSWEQASLGPGIVVHRAAVRLGPTRIERAPRVFSTEVRITPVARARWVTAFRRAVTITHAPVAVWNGARVSRGISTLVARKIGISRDVTSGVVFKLRTLCLSHAHLFQGEVQGRRVILQHGAGLGLGIIPWRGHLHLIGAWHEKPPVVAVLGREYVVTSVRHAEAGAFYWFSVVVLDETANAFVSLGAR